MSEWMRINEAYADVLAEAGLTGFDDWMTVAREDERPTGRQESLTVFRPGGERGFHVYLKRCRAKRPMGRFFLRRSRQRREAANAEFLRGLGVPTAELVAAGERRFLGCVSASFVATREIENARPLSALAPRLFADRSRRTRPLRLSVIAKLAGIARRMHHAGYIDFDLYWRNVLVQERPGDMPELYKIDSPRGGRRLFGRRRGRLRDLACLSRDARSHLSRTERARFLKAYLGRDRLSHEDGDFCERIERRKPERRV